jgi:hypothetical protein
MSQQVHGFALLAVAAAFAMVGSSATGQATFSWDFEDGTDQGWGSGFGGDADQEFPIVDIGGSLRMQVLRDGGFQEAGYGSGSDPFLVAFNLAGMNPADSVISYDYYIDTSPGDFGTYLQLATYYNGGSGGYAQDHTVPYDLELDSTQLASGQVFSGTVTETLAAKGYDLSGFAFPETFGRLGLIINGDGANATVYYDNITISAIPEPGTLGLLVIGALALLRRRRQAAA